MVEKSVCRHGMSRTKPVIIMARPIMSYQLRDVHAINWGLWNIPRQVKKISNMKIKCIPLVKN